MNDQVLTNKENFNNWVKEKTKGNEKTFILGMFLCIIIGVAFVFYHRFHLKKVKPKSELNIDYELDKLNRAIPTNNLSNLTEGYELYKQYEEMLNSEKIDSIALKELEIKLQKFLDHEK